MPEARDGAVDGGLRDEFPVLRLRTAMVHGGRGRTPRGADTAGLGRRLADLSDRFQGAHAVALRSSRPA
jgi:hypothetical protein